MKSIRQIVREELDRTSQPSEDGEADSSARALVDSWVLRPLPFELRIYCKDTGSEGWGQRVICGRSSVGGIRLRLCQAQQERIGS